MTLCLMHVEILSLLIASEFNPLLRTVCKLWCDIYDTENPNPIYRNVSNLRHNVINNNWNVYKIDDLLACGYVTKPTTTTLLPILPKPGNDNGNYILHLNMQRYETHEWSLTRNRMIYDRSVEWITQICFTRCVPVSICIGRDIHLSDFTNGAYNDITQTLSLLLPMNNSMPTIKVHADTDDFKVDVIGLIYPKNLDTWIGRDYLELAKWQCKNVYYDLFPDSIDAVCYCVMSFDNNICQISKPRESRYIYHK